MLLANTISHSKLLAGISIIRTYPTTLASLVYPELFKKASNADVGNIAGPWETLSAYRFALVADNL